jgi:hypothetical protein
MNKVSNFKFIKEVEVLIKMYVGNFANIFGIAIKSTIEFSSNIILKTNKKFSILSTCEMNSIMLLALKSMILIESKINCNSNLNLSLSKNNKNY